ncbi:hypothetical protein Scep_008575 [Stephania cephalantha]|uniref:Ubiquitin-like domain-containing protein n=1 Tax=Stephania cephalantha TaxID=152367 RepID=A0AAP0KBY1_9MAGN
MKNELQIFVQSPELRIRSRALLVNPNSTLRQIKSSLFPQIDRPETLDSIYFSFQGKVLRDSETIIDSKILPFSSLDLRIRVLGGGGDGGATGAESRDCYLNMYATKKPDKVDPNETRLSRWTTCALSFEPLRAPCVVDWLGNLFNKEPLVEALLGKKLPKAFGHIKGLKDMIPIRLSPIPGKGDDFISFDTRFQCPISGLEFNGKYKFFALKSCGHVLSAKALKEVKSSECLVCHQEFCELDKIVINGDADEVAALRERMGAEKAKMREKKEKKSKNGASRVDDVKVTSFESSRLSGAKHGIDDKAVEKALVKEGKVGDGKNSSVDAVKGRVNGSAKRFKATDAIPANATKEVYASIFTSSRKKEFKETYSCRSLPLGRN